MNSKSIAVVKIVFENNNDEKIWNAGKLAELEGYLLNGRPSTVLLVDGNARKLAILHRELGNLFEIEELVGRRFPPFGPLRRVNCKQRAISEPTLEIQTPSSNGRILGWAVAPNIPFAEIEISIDGVSVGRTSANLFREDLLRAGIDIGANGFSFRPPDRFLDGAEHKIEVRIPSDPTVSKTRTSRLPFHFNLPRPWLGVKSTPSNDSMENSEFVQIRNEVLYGEYARGLELARELVERHPPAIFCDFGLKEHFIACSTRLPSFKQRLDHRWGTLYDNTPCRQFSDCCKGARLAYNWRPAIGVTDWSDDQLVVDCPLRIRHFASKSLTRTYAKKRHIPVPKTLGNFSNLREFDEFNFPYRYVMKPVFDSGRSIYLMSGDLNLFDGYIYSKSELRNNIEEYFTKKPGSSFVVEELLRQENCSEDTNIVPLDYKLHAFGGKARIVQIDDRNTVSKDPLHRRQSWKSRDWSESPWRFRKVEQTNNGILEPNCFAEMLRVADDIASDLDDYIRVDMYATDDGPVLGELTTWTHGGAGFTEVGSDILGQAWELFS